MWRERGRLGAHRHCEWRCPRGHVSEIEVGARVIFACNIDVRHLCAPPHATSTMYALTVGVGDV
jgi:hypothetical protein